MALVYLFHTILLNLNKHTQWVLKKRDYFFVRSRALGYRSRSAFKLLEMNKKFKFMKKNISLLDLGSSPGGWSQVASSIIKEGKIIAIDKKPMEKIKNVIFFKNDFLEEESKNEAIKLMKLVEIPDSKNRYHSYPYGGIHYCLLDY